MFCSLNSWELFAQIVSHNKEAHHIALCRNNWLCPCVGLNCNMKHKDFISIKDSMGGRGGGGFCKIHATYMYMYMYMYMYQCICMRYSHSCMSA